MLQLSRNAGTGVKYIENVYFHHEAESKQTWEVLNQNRSFREKIEAGRSLLSIPIEELFPPLELHEWEVDQDAPEELSSDKLAWKSSAPCDGAEDAENKIDYPSGLIS